MVNDVCVVVGLFLEEEVALEDLKSCVPERDCSCWGSLKKLKRRSFLRPLLRRVLSDDDDEDSALSDGVVLLEAGADSALCGRVEMRMVREKRKLDSRKKIEDNVGIIFGVEFLFGRFRSLKKRRKRGHYEFAVMWQLETCE